MFLNRIEKISRDTKVVKTVTDNYEEVVPFKGKSKGKDSVEEVK